MNFFSRLSHPKYLLPLLGVFVVLGLSGAYYYYQVYLPAGGRPIIGEVTPPPPPAPPPDNITSEDPTANWSVYRSSLYNFEFKYPQGWYIQSAGESTGQIYVTNYDLSDPNYRSIPNRIKIDFYIGNLPQDWSLDSWVASRGMINIQKIAVGGVEAARGRVPEGEEHSPPGTYSLQVIFANNTNLFTVVVRPENSELLSDFDLMLPTFKFL